MDKQTAGRRVCYISRNYYSLNGAGNKAKTDNEETLRQMGATNIGLPTTFYDNKVLAFVLNLAGILKAVCVMRKGDILVLQYPVKKYFTFICRAAHLRGVRVVVIIHDLMALHRKRITKDTEMQRLALSDYIIASNEQMRQWLISQGLQCDMGALGLFDYRSEAVPAEKKAVKMPHRWALVYAGALAMRKNSYLLTLARQATDFDLHIYGNADGLPGIREAAHARCFPFTPADEFIRSAEGDFGLVWDGESLDTCQGDFGEYLRYNSPHKVSFYLRAGLPVIIWRQAAVAPIIEREGLGLCISSIAELQERLRALTMSEVEEMRGNVRRVSRQLATGHFLSKALQPILSGLDVPVDQ